VVKSQGTKKQTFSEIDLELEGIPKREQAQVKRDIGELLVAQILLYVADQGSPVVGEAWPKLSKKYKEKKEADGLTPVANLESSGELLNALTYKTTEDGLEVGFFNDQAWKADGHLKFSGLQNNTPQRRFLPGEGQAFKRDIQREIDRIILDARSEKLETGKLSGIETKKDLYEYLLSELGVSSKSEARLAVFRNPKLLQALEDEDLLDLL
jgi:hypothetical protein